MDSDCDFHIPGALQGYRDDRVEANARRIVLERAATGAGYAISVSLSTADNPRRRAALRETLMPSAFEYVNYNMPETVPQEVVARRQIARDMADPGIYSDGPRLADIIHLPPRHATLAPPVAHRRSSRELLLSRDRAVAAGHTNIVPLARPFLPKAVIDAYGEPYEHVCNKKAEGRAAFNSNFRDQESSLREDSRNLQDKLGIPRPQGGPDRMGVIEVSAAVNTLQKAMQNLENSRDTLIITLLELSRNFWPTGSVLKETGVALTVDKLRSHPKAEVAAIATRLEQEWRTAVRVDEGLNTLSLPARLDREDPFVDSASDLFGLIIPPNSMSNEIKKRREAARNYNRATAKLIRERIRHEKNEGLRQREAQIEKDVRLVQARVATYNTDTPSEPPVANTKDSKVFQRVRKATNAFATILCSLQNTKSSASDSYATVSDPDIHGSEDGDRSHGDNKMSTGGRTFEILEVDPSPERPREEYLAESPGQENYKPEEPEEQPEDIPLKSVEEDQVMGLCHPCPDFPGTYHHICAPLNPRCTNHLVISPRQGSSEGHNSDYSPPYEPSYDPQEPPRTPEQPIRLDKDTPVQSVQRGELSENGLKVLEDGKVAMIELDRRAMLLGVPVTHPFGLPENITDPFSLRSATRTHRAPIFTGGQLSRTSDEDILTVANESRKKPRVSSTSPTVTQRQEATKASTCCSFPCSNPSISSTSSQRRRTTYAEYVAKTHEELAAELQNQVHSQTPLETSNKDIMIRMLMGYDSNKLMNRTPSPKNSRRSSKNSETVSPMNIDFSSLKPTVRFPGTRSSASSSRISRSAKSAKSSNSSNSATRTGSKRASPLGGDGKPVAKRLRPLRNTKSA